MFVYWEQNVSRVHKENFDTKEDEDRAIQKPQIQNTKDEQKMKNPPFNTTLILELQMINKSMGNNYISE